MMYVMINVLPGLFKGKAPAPEPGTLAPGQAANMWPTGTNFVSRSSFLDYRMEKLFSCFDKEFSEKLIEHI